jgi:hypothetical protein
MNRPVSDLLRCSQEVHVVYWQLADIATAPIDVRFRGRCGHIPDIAECPLMTQRGYAYPQASHWIGIPIERPNRKARLRSINARW